MTHQQKVAEVEGLVHPELAAVEVVEGSGGDLSRSDVLLKGALAAGAVYGTLMVAPFVRSAFAAAGTSDVDILNFALTLEYLESAFYNEALAKGQIKDMHVLAFAKVVAKHEALHVSFLKGALGSAAVNKPKFDFKGTTGDQAMFQATSEVLEYTGVSAYLGQVGNITSKQVLGAAGSILPVEAWHAAWIADLRRHGYTPRETPLDEFVKAGGSAKCLTLRLDGEEAATWKVGSAVRT